MPQNNFVALAIKGMSSQADWAQLITALVQLLVQYFAEFSESLLAVEYRRPWDSKNGIIGEFGKDNIESSSLVANFRTRVLVLYQSEYKIGELITQSVQPFRTLSTELILLNKEGQFFEIAILEKGNYSDIQPTRICITPTTVEILVLKFGGQGMLEILKNNIQQSTRQTEKRLKLLDKFLSQLETIETVLASLPQESKSSG